LFRVIGFVVGVPGCHWLRSLEEFEAPLLNPKQNPPVPRLIHEITQRKRDVSGDTIRQLIGGIHNSGVAYECVRGLYRTPLC
jgi:hypothetical protein